MSITKEQILQAEGEELSRLLGEVLNGKHEKDEMGFCKSCYLFMTGENLQNAPTCDIELFPGNAFKWRDWAVEECGLNKLHFTLNRMYKCDEKGIASGWDFINWLIMAQAKHYLKAAALCKIAAE